jgi:SAM-dependent methyltransferase
MRELVGPTDPAAFDNPDGARVYPYLPPNIYERIFDFGCGCGRVARQLILQNPQPRRYVGIDLHRGMLEWCRRNLASHAPQFEFLHHDVHNRSFNPGEGKPSMLPFPVEDNAFTLVNALSVFTHLTQPQAEYYLTEVARVLEPHGILNSTWFLFDKVDFPMLQEETNALYVSYEDPSAAVCFARDWVRKAAAAAGLVIFKVVPPHIRGFQWTLVMAPAASGLAEIELPRDEAPVGLARPPCMPRDANRIGLD